MQTLSHYLDTCPEEIRAKMRLCHYAPGEAIISPGFCGEDIFVLISGQAKLVALRENGSSVILSLYNHWEILGELEAFTGHSCDRCIMALLPCDVYSLDKESFFQWIRYDFEFNRYILARLSYKLQCLSATSQICMGGFLREQIAHILLINLNEKQYFPYSKQVLAECIGTSIRSLNRVLAQMVQTGILEVTSSRILVKDKKALLSLIEN